MTLTPFELSQLAIHIAQLRGGNIVQEEDVKVAIDLYDVACEAIRESRQEDKEKFVR